MRVKFCLSVLSVSFFFSLSAFAQELPEENEFEEFSTGAKLATKEMLEKIPKTEVYRNFTPPRIDLTRYMPRPGRQKDSSCVGWAVAYAARTQHFAWDNKRSARKKYNIASPSALYNAAKIKGNCDSGTYIFKALDWLKNHGVPSQAEFPSNKRGQCYRKLNSSALQLSSRFKIKDYRQIEFNQNLENGIGITRIRDQLGQRKPVIFGMVLPNDFYRPRKGRIYTTTKRVKKPSGHAMVIVGFDDKKGGGAFKIQNSWGRRWGDGGYLWMSYRSFVSHAHSAYVLETRPLKKRVKPVPKPIVIEKKVDALKVAQKIMKHYECSAIEKHKSSKRKISFFAKTDADRKAITKQLKKHLPNIEIIAMTAPWPQCEARITFQKQLAKPRGLRLSLKGHETQKTEPVLRDGDPFVMKIKTPDFPSYLYATYFQTDKEGKHEAVHLIQSIDPLKQYPPNTEIVIGDGADGGDQFSISGPNYGKEMVVILASASPLYEKERPWEEVERDYLSGIRDALIKKVHGKGERLIAAQVLPLITKSGE